MDKGCGNKPRGRFSKYPNAGTPGQGIGRSPLSTSLRRRCRGPAPAADKAQAKRNRRRSRPKPINKATDPSAEVPGSGTAATLPAAVGAAGK